MEVSGLSSAGTAQSHQVLVEKKALDNQEQVAQELLAPLNPAYQDPEKGHRINVRA